MVSVEDREMSDPLAAAYDLIGKWLTFAEDEHTFNYIKEHHWTYESDTNANVLSKEYEEIIEKLIADSDKFLMNVCKLCGGENNHGSKCQLSDEELNDIPF